jgi:energy-coupling factor transporter ATP-binding protein EcfA2
LNGTAVAFLGHKGSGKSTIAAALYAQGHQLVADDVVAVDVSGVKRPTVFPALPQFKLWPEAAVACLGDMPEALPRVHPQVEKRLRPVTGRFVPGPVALGHLYVLERGSALEIERLRPQEAMIKLISYSYMALFGQQGLQMRGAQHFFQCTDLAKNIPTYRLRRPSSLALLSTTACLVDAHLTGAACVPRDELPGLE